MPAEGTAAISGPSVTSGERCVESAGFLCHRHSTFTANYIIFVVPALGVGLSEAKLRELEEIKDNIALCKEDAEERIQLREELNLWLEVEIEYLKG